MKFVWIYSLLKVKHLSSEKAAVVPPRGTFCMALGVGFGALECLLIVRPKPDAPL